METLGLFVEMSDGLGDHRYDADRFAGPVDPESSDDSQELSDDPSEAPDDQAPRSVTTTNSMPIPQQLPGAPRTSLVSPVWSRSQHRINYASGLPASATSQATLPWPQCTRSSASEALRSLSIPTGVATTSATSKRQALTPPLFPLSDMQSCMIQASFLIPALRQLQTTSPGTKVVELTISPMDDRYGFIVNGLTWRDKSTPSSLPVSATTPNGPIQSSTKRRRPGLAQPQSSRKALNTSESSPVSIHRGSSLAQL